jgi:hypothetical protein
MLYNVAFLVTWFSLLFVPFEFLVIGNKVVATSADNWVSCMFEQLKLTSDASDSSWQSICGETPYSSFEGPSVNATMFHDFTVLVLSGQSIVIALVFLPSQISRLYRSDPTIRRALMRAEVLRDRFRSLSLRYRNHAAVIPMRSAATNAPQQLPQPAAESTNKDRLTDEDKGKGRLRDDDSDEWSHEQIEAAGGRYGYDKHFSQASLRAPSVPPIGTATMGLALAQLPPESSLVAAAVGAADDDADDDGKDDDDDDKEDKDKLSSVISRDDDDESKITSGQQSYHFRPH